MKNLIIPILLLTILSARGQNTLLLNESDNSVFFPASGIGGIFKVDELRGRTNRIGELIVTNGITFGGVRQTAWPAGGTIGVVSTMMDYNFNPNEPPPVSGQVRRNAGETVLSIHKIGNDGIDHSPVLSQLPIGTSIYLQDWNDSTRWVRYLSTGLSSIVGDAYYAIPISYVSDSGVILLTQRIVVQMMVGASEGGSAGDVTGPSSSISNAIPVFSGTNGKVLRDSAVTIDFITNALENLATVPRLMNVLPSVPSGTNHTLDFSYEAMTFAVTANVNLLQSANRPPTGTNVDFMVMRLFGDSVDRNLSWNANWKRLGTNIVTIPANKVVIISAMVIGTEETGVTFAVGKEE